MGGSHCRSDCRDCNHDVERILSFVRSPQFTELWRRVCREFVPWSEFQRLEPPEGYSILDAYAVIKAMRHRSATLLPFDNYVLGVRGVDNWFSVTEEMHECLRKIASETASGSELDVYLNDRVTAQSKIAFLAEEFVSLGRRDGIEFEADRVRGIWGNTVESTSAEDRLALNFANLHATLGRKCERRVTRGLIESLNEALTEGVRLSYDPKPQPRIKARKPSLLEGPDYALGKVVELMAGTGVCGQIDPVFRSMLVSGVFWEFFPLPTANALTEMLLRSLFYMKASMLVMTWVPFSCISEQWEGGKLTRPSVPCGYLDEVPDTGEGYDSTGHFTAELMLVLYELERLKGRLVATMGEDDANRKVLEGEAYLNPRQRDVLLFALRNPGYQLSIADHQKLYRLAYATARQDLVDLESVGFMSQFKRGRAFVFQATPLLFEFAKSHRSSRA